MELKETEKRLLEAVSKIIEEEGFTQIGINRIAKKAQCDKVLIYRYFGGLDGLLAAWAKQYDFYSFAYSEFAGQIAQVTYFFIFINLFSTAKVGFFSQSCQLFLLMCYNLWLLCMANCMNTCAKPLSCP